MAADYRILRLFFREGRCWQGLVVFGKERALRVAFGIVELPVAERPEESDQSKNAERQGDGDEIEQNIHVIL